MPNAQAGVGGFLEGFVNTSLQLQQLKLASDREQAQEEAQKARIKLLNDQLKGKQAEREMAIQQRLNQIKFASQLRLKLGQNLGPQQEIGLQALQQGKYGDALKAFEAPEGGATNQPLVNAILAQPRLYESLGTKERASILPSLVNAGFTAEDVQDPAARQKQALDRRKTLFEIDRLTREKQGILAPVEREAQAMRLRTAIVKEPAFRVAQEITSGLDNVRVGAKRGDAAGDLAIVNGFAKILDPTGVVRPAEFTTVQEAQGFFERVWNIREKINTGAILKDNVRQRFLEAAEQIAATKFDRAREQILPIYKPRADASGIPFNELFVDPTEGRKPATKGNIRLSDPLGILD